MKFKKYWKKIIVTVHTAILCHTHTHTHPTPPPHTHTQKKKERKKKSYLGRKYVTIAMKKYVSILMSISNTVTYIMK